MNEFEKKYPLHAALAKRKTEHQFVEAFLLWLECEDDLRIVQTKEMVDDTHPDYDEEGPPEEQPTRMFDLNVSHSKVIARYFEIDEKEFSKEKDRMLQELRETNSKPKPTTDAS